MSTPQRIRTGFHRIGVTIAFLIGMPGVGVMLMSVPIGMGWMPEEAKLPPSEWPYFLWGGAIFLGFALLGCLAVWTLGWIIAGFFGEGENP